VTAQYGIEMPDTFQVARPAGVNDVPEVLRRAGIDQHSVIQITGPDGFPTLLWLCRHGFENVGYVRSGTPCPAETADALIIPHACTADELVALLDRGPRVRHGGTLVFRAIAANDEASRAIEAVLHRFGYHVAVRCPGGRREVSIARRDASAYARAA
jgi:hypothetical protein